MLFCQLRETECNFLFVSTPKYADCVHILMRAGRLPGPHNLEAEFNYFVLSYLLVFFSEEMNLLILDWRQESKSLSVVLCSQTLQVVWAQVAQASVQKKMTITFGTPDSFLFVPPAHTYWIRKGWNCFFPIWYLGQGCKTCYYERKMIKSPFSWGKSAKHSSTHSSSVNKSKDKHESPEEKQASGVYCISQCYTCYKLSPQAPLQGSACLKT